jgi:hypothetical protein
MSRRSGLAQLRHPARRVTCSLRDGTPSGSQSPPEADYASGNRRIDPMSSDGPVLDGTTSAAKATLRHCGIDPANQSCR